VEVEGVFILFRAWICRKCEGVMNQLIEGIQQHDTKTVRRLERQIASDLGIQVANGTNLTERSENNQLDFLWCTAKALRDADSWDGFEGLRGRNVESCSRSRMAGGGDTPPIPYFSLIQRLEYVDYRTLKVALGSTRRIWSSRNTTII
jgi:hypothetical protein